MLKLFSHIFTLHHPQPILASCPYMLKWNFRAMLEMKRLHRKGLGTSSKQAEPITPDEESPLWTSGQLGTHSAKALLNTVKFLG